MASVKSKRVQITVKRQKPGPKAGFKYSTPRSHATTPKPVLIELLFDAAQLRNESPELLAAGLSIGYPYLMALARGTRPTADLGRDILTAAAKYLDVPIAQAYLWAGALLPTDFFFEPSLRRELQDVFTAIQTHPHWGGFCVKKSEWDSLSDEARILYALLFEKATDKHILSRTKIAEAQSRKK
ncbi:MAG: hypothetical protein NT159_07760 [Proteobacteria bacterium]|nr:hypothetical protein [Pseudomonadota bacterium]